MKSQPSSNNPTRARISSFSEETLVWASQALCRGSKVESCMSRVEGNMLRVKGTMSRILKNIKNTRK